MIKNGLIVEGMLKSGERFHFQFGGFKPNDQLLKLLNADRPKAEHYKADRLYMSIYSNVDHEDGSCGGFPANRETRDKWLDLFGQELILCGNGCRRAIRKLQEYTRENVDKFLDAVGVNVEKFVMLDHR